MRGGIRSLGWLRAEDACHVHLRTRVQCLAPTVKLKTDLHVYPVHPVACVLSQLSQ